MRSRSAHSRRAGRVSIVRRGRGLGGDSSGKSAPLSGGTAGDLMSPRDRQFVRERANARCEYCHFHEDHLPLWPFHLDHIVAQQHLGPDEPTNLAWACQRCNLCKGTNLMGVDPDSSRIVALFNPRTDRWDEHFVLEASRIVGVTPTGRATAWLLQMNTDQRVELRGALLASGRWHEPR